MGALDELVAAWRANPDAGSTIALSSYLCTFQNEELIREVGSSAETWHREDAEVMIAIGRMYLDSSMLNEAQVALVSAGKASPRDSRPFRFLGEVLLRRGDAVRSEKVLARAIELGSNDTETRLWHDRAVVYVALQKRIGVDAVAREVSRTLPRHVSIPEPDLPLAASRRSPDDPPTLPKMVTPFPVSSQFTPTHPAPPAATRPRTNPPPLPPSARPLPEADVFLPPREPPRAAMSPRTPAAPWLAQSVAALDRVPHLSPRTPAAPWLAPSQASDRAQIAPATPGIAWSPREAPSARTAERAPETDPGDTPQPNPELVLEHLARAGIYEPIGGALPAWEKPIIQRPRGTWLLVLATVVLLGAGGGAYTYAQRVKVQRTQLARSISDDVDRALRTGRPDAIHATDDKLSRVFELDSRSQRAAILWLKNRVLTELLVPGEAHGIDSAVHRALSVDVPEERVAFGRIAAFLSEGDLAGAAALLPKWDKRAGTDPFYQLAAGAALERAGDVRAIERYEAARALDKSFAPAEMMLARLVLLELGPEKGKPVVDSLQQKIGDAPMTRALYALNWAVTPERPKELPPEAQLAPDTHDALPSPLRPVPNVVEALQAIDVGELARARDAISKALGNTFTPAMATRLGFLAIQAGDEQLARNAALRALQFAAVYPGARVLAARVALLGGRIDEAKKAIEELEPDASEVAIVRGVVAYESLDSSELSSSVSVLGDAVKHRSDYAALAAAPGVLLGTTYPKPEALPGMSQPSVPWGELVAIDAALDTGQIDAADKLASRWVGPERPVYALRLARLRRYQNRAENAVKASGDAAASTMTARVLIERVLDLLLNKQASDAHDLVARYPSLLGPMTAWLSAIVDVQSAHAAEAKVKVGQLDLPPEEAPLVLRMLVARALAWTDDKRAKDYVHKLEKKLGKNPELLIIKKKP